MISQLELRQQLEVDTPKGRGRLFLSTEYGSEIEKIFTVYYTMERYGNLPMMIYE